MQKENENDKTVFKLGCLTIEPKSLRAYVSDSMLRLTEFEYLILESLMRHGGSIVSSRFILNYVRDHHYKWIGATRPNASYFDNSLITQMMARLRRKLRYANADIAIDTLYNKGYAIRESSKPIMLNDVLD